MNARARITAAVMGLVVVAAGTQATTSQGTRMAPGPQSAHSLVYDEHLQRIVLVNGHSGRALKDTADVWSWDGTKWAPVHHPGLPSRYLGAATYDSRRQRLVVFGGRVGKDGLTRGDTWEWDGGTWREASDVSVGIRAHHAMAYDEHRGRTVMYGGTVPRPGTPSRQHTEREWPSDTWEWDGARWHLMPAVGPGSRNGPALAYDASRKNIVLFGGVGDDGAYRSGTWTWDGTVWRQAAVAGPPLRASHQLAYDSDAGVVLLYGGGNRTGRLQDMWQWDGERWEEIAMSGPTPGPRNGHAMAYDRARGRLVLYGGFGAGPDALADTWEWDGSRWTDTR